MFINLILHKYITPSVTYQRTGGLCVEGRTTCAGIVGTRGTAGSGPAAHCPLLVSQHP